MPRIIQITDSHVTARGTLWKDQLDTGARLTRMVQAVNRTGPDLVIHSGDVVETGGGPEGPLQYDRAAGILAGLTAPLRLIPGNHDGRSAMRAAFPDQNWTGLPFLNFSIDVAGLHIIGLDSVAEGETGGVVDAARLDWLAGILDDRPVLLFLHHPPCPLGLPFMDGFGFEGTEALARVIRDHNILRLACGHVHADVATGWAGTTVAAAEATSVQIPPDMPAFGDLPEDRPRMTGVDTLRIRVHDWDGTRLSIKTVPAEAAPDQIAI